MIKAFCDRCGRESEVPENRVTVLYVAQIRFNYELLTGGLNPEDRSRPTIALDTDDFGSARREVRLGNLCDLCLDDLATFVRTRVSPRVQEKT